MKSMEPMLDQARVTLSMALSDPHFIRNITRRGYGAEQLQEGMALREIARNFDSNYKGLPALISERNTNSSTEMENCQVSIQSRCAECVWHSRNITVAATLLQLNSTFPKNFEQWYAQAKIFISP